MNHHDVHSPLAIPMDIFLENIPIIIFSLAAQAIMALSHQSAQKMRRNDLTEKLNGSDTETFSQLLERSHQSQHLKQKFGSTR
jgi:hypothetical protein